MEKGRFPAIFVLFFVSLMSLSAQSANQRFNDFTPNVSQIRVESRNNLIRLTWTDSPDVRGPVFIFRSARPFTGSVPANIRPVIVRYGAQYYIDDTDGMDNLYYFIAASDTSGRRYDIVIPRINSVFVNLANPQSPVVENPPVIIASEPQNIFNMTARRDGERVIIRYNSLNPQKNAVLYRSMQPVTQPQDLLNAVIVQSGFRNSFIDRPVSGYWYYAVIYEDEITSGNISIKPGINTTIAEVVIFDDELTERFFRPIPLPFMSGSGNAPDGFLSDVSQPNPLSAEAIVLLKNSRLPHKAPLELKKPRVFSVDMQSPAGGEESALVHIVTEYFRKYDWEKSLTYLQQYLSVPRSPEVQARGRFYLAQTLYFTGSYREALWEFLSFRYSHPVEANSWIDAVLAAMVH